MAVLKIDEKTGYLAEKQDPADLYRVMKKFVSLSYDERKKMGEAGRRHMKGTFDKKIVIEQTLKKMEGIK